MLGGDFILDADAGFLSSGTTATTSIQVVGMPLWVAFPVYNL